MSQYGAMGYAEHGWNAAQILAHYYTGTALGHDRPARRCACCCSRAARARVQRRAPGRRAASSTPRGTYTVGAAAPPRCAVEPGGKRVATFPAPLQVAGAGGVTTLSGATAPTAACSSSARHVRRRHVINAVALDDYVQGVVPVESPRRGRSRR